MSLAAGDRDAAREHFERALEIRPGLPPAVQRLEQLNGGGD
ncbi:MAG: hypothetical protein ACE5GJ_08925 [Gemmatimonadota bacterium]